MAFLGFSPKILTSQRPSLIMAVKLRKLVPNPPSRRLESQLGSAGDQKWLKGNTGTFSALRGRELWCSSSSRTWVTTLRGPRTPPWVPFNLISLRGESQSSGGDFVNALTIG